MASGNSTILSGDDDPSVQNLPLSNVDNEEVDPQPRDRSQTDNYVEYRFDIFSKRLKHVISTWRKEATKLEKLLSDCTDVNTLRRERNLLDDKMTQVTTCYNALSQIPHDRVCELFSMYDAVEKDNYRLARDIAGCIRSLESEFNETASRVSIGSNSSKLSHSSRTRVDAAADVAALKAKLKFMDIEAQQRKELERTQALKEFEMAQARLDAIVKIESEDQLGDPDLNLPMTSKKEYIANYVENHVSNIPNLDTHCFGNVIISSLSDHNPLNPSAPIFTIAGPAADTVPYYAANMAKCSFSVPPLAPSIHVPTANQAAGVNCPNQQFNELGHVVKLLAEQMTLSRLPTPEPGIFCGDPLAYPAWKSAFETLIGQKGIPPCEKIFYLKKYISGQARESVEGFLLLTTDNAYEEARNLLEQRYGNSFAIAAAFREKLYTWPKIPPRDGVALRKYADFLKQCQVAMETNSSLRVLDDDQENAKMLLKLPDWLTLQWGRVIYEWRGKFQQYPPFAAFVSFVTKESQIACDPVMQGLRQSQAQGRPGSYSATSSSEKRQPYGHRTYATETTQFSNTICDTPSKSCKFCMKTHHLDDCCIFLSKNLQDRRDFVRKNGLCFACLEHGHRSKECQERRRCKTCSRSHPTCFHGDMRKSDKSINTEIETLPIVSHAGLGHQRGSKRSCMCSMIVPVWLSHCDNPERELLVYALLDTQSDTTFILDDACEALGLDGPSVDLLLSTMTAEEQIVKSRKLNGLVVRGHDSSFRIPLPVTYSRELMPSNRTHIPTPDTARALPHLKQIAHKLMPLSDAVVGLLIGYNCSRALAPREVIAPNGNEPYAQKTDLGWGIVGVIHKDEDSVDQIGVSHRILAQDVQLYDTHSTTTNPIQITLQTKIKEAVAPHDVTRMMERDFNECSSNEHGPSHEDLQFLKLMKEGIHRTSDQHYEMPLPLKDQQHAMPNDKTLALRRLKQLELRFKRNQKYRDDYCTFMERVITDGYAERVPDKDLERDDGIVWYIPHHGVYHPKKPNKIRIVFDCSATYKGESLNNCLIQGPDLMNKLVGVLCRFRQERMAFICDIEQMFFQFRVNQEHRDLLRFFWWDSQNYDGKPVEYRMNVHLFGAASSPACANFGLKQAAVDFEDEFGPEAASFVCNDFYVDDGLKSVASVEKAVKLIEDSREMCKKGGLRLHKFVSNCREVIKTIPQEDRAQGIQNIDLIRDDLPVERALGVFWCIESDVFNFRIILQDKPLTRRGVLSTISSIYDPLGFIAPVLLIGKQILQRLCKEKSDWDTELPDSLRVQWEHWRNDLVHLEGLKIQRCFKPKEFSEIHTAELHHFSDASSLGYGQCSYLRLVDTQKRVHCSLVMGKARVTPLKPITIPRLELTAALVSVRVSTFLGRELEYDNITNIFWTDSKIVLGYLTNDSRRFHVFVSNRVQQIRNETDPSQWRYVRTDVNPADEASRGLSSEELVSKARWTSGPAFLWEKDILSTSVDNTELELQPNDPEVKQAKVYATQFIQEEGTSFIDRLSRFSNWQSAKRATAVCLRLASNHGQCTKNGKGCKYIPCSVSDLCRAGTRIIYLVQQSAFKDDLSILQSFEAGGKKDGSSLCKRTLQKSSPLYRLDPFLDEDGVLRVGGRIRRSKHADSLKHPVILPKRHHITHIVIRHYHEKMQHQGRGITVNAIRSAGFWILGCGSEVSYYISQCVRCRRLRSKVQEQKMADLPVDRVNPSPPFTFCGMDCFGPFYIKEGRKELKRYGVLFTCMASRAIHVETVNSMTTDSFINSLRRFLAIRGPIRQLRSDQGTNFVGASNELTKALSTLDNDRIRNFLLPQDCDFFEFKMNVPSASHMGGVWERQIRTVRSVLSSLLDHCSSQLDDETLRTLMCEVMSIVNSRPLTTDNLNCAESPTPLTPNHLLTMKSSVILPPPGNFVREDIYSRKRWRRVQHIANEFWQRWKKEYLQTLQMRQKWTHPRRDVQIGDIVIVKDENLPRNQWLLARVDKTFSDADGHVRTVKLCIADRTRDRAGKLVNPPTYMNRPIQKLVVLLDN